MARKKKKELSSCRKKTEEELLRTEIEKQARRKIAERAIKSIQRQFPNKSLIQLLPVILKHCGPLAAKLTIERIERNQGNSLNSDDRSFLMEIKERINPPEEECPIGS